MSPKTSSDENNVDKTSKTDEPKRAPASFLSLFGYASGFDKCLIAVGSVFSIAIGTGLPAIMIFMGELSATFIEYEIYNQLSKWPDAREYYRKNLSQITDKEQFLATIIRENPAMNLDVIQVRLKLDNKTFVDQLNKTVFNGDREFEVKFIDDSNYWSYLMFGVGVAFLICGYVMVTTFSIAANNQIQRIRLLFFRSILRQDITWFDTKTSGDFATKVTADLDKLQEGVGDKVSLCLFAFSTVFCSLGTALYYGWELTLVILAITPALIIAFAIIAKIQAKYSTTEADSYGKAGAVAEEVLGAIRTVYAFDGQRREIERYDKNLEPAKRSGVRRTLFTGLGLGIMWLCIYCSYGLAFWYGVRLIIRSIEDGSNLYEASTMLIVFFAVLMGTFSIGQTTPYFEAFAQARGSAALIFEVIQRQPDIDSSSGAGDTIADFRGRVELRGTHFSYPSRPDVPVLRGLDLVAEPGQTVALVGPSGCGKSTVIQLVQRFYDVSGGQVLIDGRDIRELNVGWLRDRIGVVGQEPVLFGCSIADNIRLGYGSASQADVEAASVDANAYDFVQRLPARFETLVGENGSQLSGGQKQRIAIARALVRKPKILLLDESTSALDTQSESVVQAALDRASVGRTTFIVAHRLSTIRCAHKIIVINSGKVEEVGSHEELMKRKGLYYNLVKTQQQSASGVESDVNLDEDWEDSQPVSNGNLHTRAISVDSDTAGAGDIAMKSRNSSVVPEEAKESPSQTRLLSLLKPDRYLVLTGAIMAFLMGLSIPTYSLIFGDIMATMAETSIDKIREDVFLYAMLFVAMGIVSGIVAFLQLYLFGVCGERLTMRLRRMVFTAMLQQEVGWYDEQENSTGALCSRLSADASAVQGAAGSRMSTLCQAASTLCAGIIIAMIYNWKLGLVMIGFTPFVIAATYFQMKILSGQVSDDKKSQEEASRIAVEAITCIRTVASLHQENTFLTNYTKALETRFEKSKIKAHMRGITFGVAQSLGNFSYAVALFYGCRLIVDQELTYGDLFKSTEALIFGTAMVGQAVAFAPDYQKGRLAAVHIFKLLDRLPKICVNQSTGDMPDVCDGNVRFEDLEFTYPTRPNVKILNGLSFDVGKGQTVALVGASGCGKSTIIQLIQRFYECDGGEVIMDNKNIVNLNIPWLRRKLGIVSQEPVLFGYSIADNIAYGDNSRTVSLNEVIRASERANIHSFIKSLPMGYDTPVGDKGTQLSGGQKQRIAIARALVRDPQILLLDEATSALDSESEKVVQQALDEAREGRTCIVIAHRLSTIQNADKIVVVSKGVVVEEGRHQELIAKRGAYYDLYNVQNLMH